MPQQLGIMGYDFTLLLIEGDRVIVIVEEGIMHVMPSHSQEQVPVPFQTGGYRPTRARVRGRGGGFTKESIGIDAGRQLEIVTWRLLLVSKI